MPQLFLWPVRSKHEPLQFVNPGAQVPVMHAPFEQIWAGLARYWRKHAR